MDNQGLYSGVEFADSIKVEKVATLSSQGKDNLVDTFGQPLNYK